MKPSWYWLAINGASVAMAGFPLGLGVKVIPRPDWLIGFPTAEEQRAAQKFLLTASIPAIIEQQKEWQVRTDVKIIQLGNPDPPTRGQTIWMEDREDRRTT